MLEIVSLCLTYKKQSSPAIDGLSCSWDTAGLVAIVGKSGVGKSTLISCIAGIQGDALSTVAQYSGSVLLDGAKPASIRGPTKVSWVPQIPSLLDHLTVLENVVLPLSMLCKFDRAGAEDTARGLLGALDVLESAKARPRQLSGGERTRVSVARALVSEPKYLFLDEPFSGLDLSNRWIMYDLIRRVRSKEGLCTLFTSHNIPEAALIADRIVVVTKTAGHTAVKLIQNSPTLVEGEAPWQCLASARARAASIEREVFLQER